MWRICSTVGNYDTDMQAHVMRSKETLVSELVSGKSWKTNKSTWKVTFLSLELDRPLKSPKRAEMHKNRGSVHWNKNKLVMVVLCFRVVLNVVGVTHTQVALLH